MFISLESQACFYSLLQFFNSALLGSFWIPGFPWKQLIYCKIKIISGRHRNFFYISCCFTLGTVARPLGIKNLAEKQNELAPKGLLNHLVIAQTLSDGQLPLMCHQKYCYSAAQIIQTKIYAQYTSAQYVYPRMHIGTYAYTVYARMPH